MIEEQGQVISLDGDEIWVETQRRSACGQCSANKGCGTAVLDKVLGNKRSKIRVLNPKAKKVSIGDEVIVGIEEHALVRGSLAVYIVPLISLFLFGLLADVLATQLNIVRPDVFVSIIGLFGLTIGFFYVKYFTSGIGDDPRYQPVLLHRVLTTNTV